MLLPLKHSIFTAFVLLCLLLGVPSLFVRDVRAVELTQLVATGNGRSRSGGVAIRSGEDVVGMVASVWDDVVGKHQDGLLDPKADPRAVSAHLSAHEAMYHYRASRDGVVDSARFLITFGVASSLSETSLAESSLLRAIAENNVTGVQDLLETGGIDVNDVEADKSFGSTPLHFAVALENRSAIIDLLLEYGADVEARAAHGGTPLMIAASLDNVDAVRLLVEKGGAVLHAAHAFAKTTALHFAAEMGNVRSIKEICRHLGGVHDINSWRTSSGGTPLHTAADSNRPEAVRVLITECQADVNALLNGDTTPLYLAAQRGFVQVVETLAELKVDLNYVMPRETEFSKQKVKRTQYLVPVERVAGDSERSHYDYLNKNSEIGNGATALHAACENGHRDAVVALLKFGAKQLDSMEGTTPLVISLQYRHPTIALALLADGHSNPKVNARTKRDGAFALFVAAGNGYSEVVDALLERKDLIVDLRNFAKASALSHALYKGHLGIADKLLKEGNGKVEAMELQALLNSDLALKDNRLTLELLERFAIHADSHNSVNTVLNALAGLSTLSIAQQEFLNRFISHHSIRDRINLLESDKAMGATPIHVAAQAGNLPFLQIVFQTLGNRKENQSVVNARGRGKLSGATPLYLAAAENHVEVVKFLVQTMKADVSLGVVQNDSELPSIFVASEKGYNEIVQLLLNASGGNARAYSAKLSSTGPAMHPVEIAASQGHGSTVRLLLQNSVSSGEALAALSAAISNSKHLYSVVAAASDKVVRDQSLNVQRIQQLTRLLLGQRESRASEGAAVVPREHSDALSSMKMMLSSWSHVTDELYFSPLHAAIISYSDAEDDDSIGELRSLDFVDALLADRPLNLRKAFLQLTQKTKMTPLALAVEAGRAKIVETLLDALDLQQSESISLKKEVLNTVNANGETPIDVARRLRDLQLIKLLDNAASNDNDSGDEL